MSTPEMNPERVEPITEALAMAGDFCPTIALGIQRDTLAKLLRELLADRNWHRARVQVTDDEIAAAEVSA